MSNHHLLYTNEHEAGCDEAGRGCLAGPVFAAAVILSSDTVIPHLDDSKKLSSKQREKCRSFIEQEAISWAIGIVSADEIDQINILQATKLAMFLAYENLCQKYQIFPQVILVDGNFKPFAPQDKISEISAIVKGDQKSLSIAAASIIAKETRDKIMQNLHQEFPDYGWNKNFGYPTKLHVEKIKEFGICKFHRLSFEPIKTIHNNENYFRK